MISSISRFIDKHLKQRAEMRKISKERFNEPYSFRNGHYDWTVQLKRRSEAYVLELTRTVNSRISTIVKISFDPKTAMLMEAKVIQRRSTGGINSDIPTNIIYYSTECPTQPGNHHVGYMVNNEDCRLEAGINFMHHGQRTNVLLLDQLTGQQFDDFLRLFGLGFLGTRWANGLLDEEFVRKAWRSVVGIYTYPRNRVSAELKALMREGVIKGNRTGNQVGFEAGVHFEEYIKSAMSSTTFENATLRIKSCLEVGVWPYRY